MGCQIDTAYNNQGLASLLTSYADTGGTTIVNQVENVYNPGAAAHTRPIGGTGFRGDEGGLPGVLEVLSDGSQM